MDVNNICTYCTWIIRGTSYLTDNTSVLSIISSHKKSRRLLSVLIKNIQHCRQIVDFGRDSACGNPMCTTGDISCSCISHLFSLCDEIGDFFIVITRFGDFSQLTVV